MRWWSGEAAQFGTRLSPNECLERLRAHLAPPWNPFAGGSFAGTADRNRVAITPRHIAMHNSWQTWFVGRIEARGNGAIISGHFRVARFTSVFMLFWVGAVACIAVTVTATSIANRSASWPNLIPFVMLAFGFCLPRFGRLLARKDKPAIVAFLERELLAAPSTPIAPTMTS